MAISTEISVSAVLRVMVAVRMGVFRVLFRALIGPRAARAKGAGNRADKLCHPCTFALGWASCPPQGRSAFRATSGRFAGHSAPVSIADPLLAFAFPEEGLLGRGLVARDRAL